MLPWNNSWELKGCRVSWYIENGYYREISCHFVINTLYNPKQRYYSVWGNCTLTGVTGGPVKMRPFSQFWLSREDVGGYIQEWIMRETPYLRIREMTMKVMLRTKKEGREQDFVRGAFGENSEFCGGSPSLYTGLFGVLWVKFSSGNYLCVF